MEITKLASPIDAMYLIHKALRAEATRVEQMASELEVNGSLQPFRLAFNSWVIALEYHAETEDKYVTAVLANCQPAGDSQAEQVWTWKSSAVLGDSRAKGEGSGLAGQVKTAMVVLGEIEHRELVSKIEDVLAVLDEEIGKTSVIVRTKQHLYGQVVALRIAQEDHLETEEALVLPTLRQRLSEQQQLEVAKHLLIDEEAQEACWMLDWVTKDLTPGEKNLLANLEARFQELPC
jgi:hypothetical protein